MHKTKAKSWEQMTEGMLTTSEIELLLTKKQPINLSLLNAVPNTLPQAVSISIFESSRKKYTVLNHLGQKSNKIPYKYLSCAVKLAVKECKSLIRTGQWRVVTK